MNRFNLVLVLICLTTVGCTSRRQMRQMLDSLHSENLTLENQYYEMEAEKQRLEQELEYALKHGGKSTGKRSEPEPYEPYEPYDDPDEVETPLIEVPGGVQQPTGMGELVPPANSQSSRRQTTEDQTTATAAPAPEPPRYTPPQDTRVTHIVIDPIMTRGHDFDGLPGDDGLALFIEPRNGDDQFVPVAGMLTISVIDANAEGTDQYVGKWELTTDEVEDRIHAAVGRGRGIQLKLPWTKLRPVRSDLKVFVRYRSSEGKVCESSSDIKVALADTSGSKWTQRAQFSPAASSTDATTDLAEIDNPSPLSPLSRDLEIGEPVALPPTRIARPTWSPIR